MAVTHFSKISTRPGVTYTGTVCNRMSGAGADINCTTIAAEVTCKICRRMMPTKIEAIAAPVETPIAAPAQIITKAKIKYVARLNGTIVGTRSSARVLTHAVVLNGHDKTDHVETWCSSLSIAEAVQRRFERCAFRADVVPAERIQPKAAPRGSNVDAIAALAEAPIAEAPALDPRIGMLRGSTFGKIEYYATLDGGRRHVQGSLVHVQAALIGVDKAAAIAAAKAARKTAKLQIENIYVHTGGLGGQASVHWTIGARRFHVWLRPNDRTAEDVVHSNPVTPTPNARRDEHRSLDRTCIAQSAIWSEVWAIVQRDGLIAKCRQADKQKRDCEQRRTELNARRYELEQAVISAWRAGQLDDSSNARELLALDRDAADALAGLTAAAADQVQA